MKLFKVWFKNLKRTRPNLLQNEIDCALGWMGALETIQSWINNNPSCGELEKLHNFIKEELRNRK